MGLCEYEYDGGGGNGLFIVTGIGHPKSKRSGGELFFVWLCVCVCKREERWPLR